MIEQLYTQRHPSNNCESKWRKNRSNTWSSFATRLLYYKTLVFNCRNVMIHSYVWAQFHKRNKFFCKQSLLHVKKSYGNKILFFVIDIVLLKILFVPHIYIYIHLYLSIVKVLKMIAYLDIRRYIIYPFMGIYGLCNHLKLFLAYIYLWDYLKHINHVWCMRMCTTWTF